MDGGRGHDSGLPLAGCRELLTEEPDTPLLAWTRRRRLNNKLRAVGKAGWWLLSSICRVAGWMLHRS
jgi:hypothetical protein